MKYVNSNGNRTKIKDNIGYISSNTDEKSFFNYNYKLLTLLAMFWQIATMKLNSDNDKVVKGVVFGDEEKTSKDSNMQFRIFKN